MNLSSYLTQLHRMVSKWFADAENEQQNGQEYGQGLVEYALILLLVAVIVIVLLALFGSAVGNLYSNVINWI